MKDTMSSEETGRLYRRSCHRCNQKKTRCSKTQPCDRCIKSDSDCVFPGPGRAPRRKKRALKAELASRLQALEKELRLLTKGDKGSPSECRGSPGNPRNDVPEMKSPRDAEQSFGKLIVEGSSTQHVMHTLLVHIENQIEKQKRSMNASNEARLSDESIQRNDDASNKRNQFLFGFSSLAFSLETFHPNITQSQILWHVYQENVAPVVMIFHKPTLIRLIYKAASNTGFLDRATEAIVFAVYFAAVNSMGAQECEDRFSQNQSSLREYFEFATQQALARAGFLQSRSLEVLQAAVLFLTCLRSPGDADFVWSMIAILHRNAKRLGLHQDGSLFGLSLFEVEMRRRLWWHLYLLDTQSSEFHASDTQITESTYDTKLPLNINDSDISLDSFQVPEPRVGFTEMSFFLARIEMNVRCRNVLLNSRGESSHKESNVNRQSTEERVRALQEVHTYIDEHYLRFCDVTVPLQWVTATVIRIALARAWLTVRLSHPSLTHWVQCIETPKKDLSRDQFFFTAIELVEFAHLLETDTRTRKWSWLFEGYPQWQAAVIVLHGLCYRQQDTETRRAWLIVEKAAGKWTGRDFPESSITMRAVSHLMQQAAEAQGYIWNLRSDASGGSLY